MTDFTLQISTENGTGSMTANKVLLRALLQEGLYAQSKNLFPSNIAGLPTTFIIRISKFQTTGLTGKTNLYIGFNKKTLEADVEKLDPNCFFIFNNDFKQKFDLTNQIGIDCRKTVKAFHESASVRKLLYNMLYVGSSLALLGCNLEKAKKTAKAFFKRLPEDIIEANLRALEAGYQLIEKPLFQIEKHNDSPNYIYEGNQCSALGFLDGGANVVTWYPITPSSSVAEGFEQMNQKYCGEKANLRSVLQCEDELASAVAALGAGWSGGRAFTATSGPGLSLMQEAIGLGYFTETPFVILDVERAGPATGLPTRTAQGDLTQAHYSSHGDTLHPVLLPGNPQEAYDDSFNSLNLSHAVQSPVMILSDLDLGMNEWTRHQPLEQQKTKIDNGKIQFDPVENFKRYNNSTAVSTRSIPRLSDTQLSYFTRGSGHNEDGSYSEDPEVYSKKILRLKEKILASKNSEKAEGFVYYPKDIYDKNDTADTCVITWGSTGQIEAELKELLDFDFSYLRLRSLPVSNKILDSLAHYKKVFIVEQNRDGQMNQILKATSSEPLNTFSICCFDGHPISAQTVASKITQKMEEL